MKLSVAVTALFLLFAPQAALAQNNAVQTLTDCVTRAATDDDDIVLVRWIFMAMARHSSVSQFANITDAQRVESNRQMGALVNKLVLDTCPNEARAAFAANGQDALAPAFEALGKRAMDQIMGHPDVNAAVIEMTAYIDLPRLRTLIVPRSPTH